MDANLILHLPFDDADGLIAHDFSQYKNDAELSNGAAFDSNNAKMGKAMSFNVDGEVATKKEIPFSGNFTLSLWVNPVSDSIGWMLNLPGINQFKEQWLDVLPGEWLFLAFVKDESNFKVYRNRDVVFNENLSNTPTGLTINDNSLFGTKASIDEVRMYDVAKAAREIVDLQKDTDVEYYIDGRNFKEFGVYVSKSAGLVGRLSKKEALQVEWDNYHGVVRDKKRPRYKEREIVLDCFLEASGRSAYVRWVNEFFKLFDKEGNHRLRVDYDGTSKPLVYEVELIDDVDPEKDWGQYNNDLMVGTFKMKLVEDEPVKRVLRFVSTAENNVVNITATSVKLLNVYWGDGTHTYDVSGKDAKVEHTYAVPGEYDIVVTGVIEDIEEFSTNAIVIWDILK